MKPQTKFRRTVTAAAKKHGITVTVDEYMSGVDSRTRKGFTTFMLSSESKIEENHQFLAELETINGQAFEGKHSITGLNFSVDMAVRYLKLAGEKFLFLDGRLQPQT